MTSVVTGASGHLGGVLVRELVARGRKVRAVYRSDRSAIEGVDCEAVRADVCDERAMRGALDGAETLFHFAGEVSVLGDPTGALQRVNVLGVRAVMNAALDAGVRRVVHCSSVSALDPGNAGEVMDETAPRVGGHRHPAYYLSKADGEREVLRAIERGLDAVIVNPTGVIGPCDFKPSRMGMVFLALARRAIPALVNGSMDWVDVRDVAEGSIAAAARGDRGANYILGGHRATIRSIARTAEGVTGTRAPRVVVPMTLARIGAPFAELFARATRTDALYTRESLVSLRLPRVSLERSARVLSYAPRPLEETVADLYRWFRENGRM